LEHILLRWHISLPNDAEFLGDQWERSYGDLAWRSSVPNRIMPWYFLMTSGRVTSGFGVRVGAPALAFWQADPEGISLWLDVRNGGSPVQLSGRALEAVHVVTVSQKDVSPFSAARQLCKLMSPAPRLPKLPVYGGNNWYYTYGENFTASDIVRDGELLAECADGAANRPYMVIDMGWERADEGAGPTNETNNRFPDMPALVAKLNKIGVRPGIWLRPLLTTEKLPESWRMASSAKRMKEGFFVIDPSIPEALAHIQDSVKVVKEWGFNLIKHDFSTYDMLGRWGFDMGATLTDPNWNFADKSRTTAEIIRSFYAGLREAAGDALLLGCNTMGHLGAGLFELQRIGDDTSGRDWERTRKMGVNTLAFRLPQHNTFFSADADCVAITPQVPWNMTRQWLDLVARSGTALFVSADPKSIGPEQKTALRAAFQSASKPRGTAEPVDWRETTAPEKWVIGGSKATYQWYLPEGASPFGT
jgi:alpha-galactosidase